MKRLFEYVVDICRAGWRIFGLCLHEATRRDRLYRTKRHGPATSTMPTKADPLGTVHLFCVDCDKDLGPAVLRTEAERKHAQALAQLVGHAGKAQPAHPKPTAEVVGIGRRPK